MQKESFDLFKETFTEEMEAEFSCGYLFGEHACKQRSRLCKHTLHTAEPHLWCHIH